MLVDLHCHIIPGIDDGAKDVDTALHMCRIAVEEGIGHIIATPHYIEGELHNDYDIIQQKLGSFRNVLINNNIDISIYPGSEIFIFPQLPQIVREGKICTLNNSRYILIELPMMSVPDYTTEVIYSLRIDGFIPIIAHPERNMAIAEKPNLLFDLIKRGALSQINSTSITGVFGKKTKQAAATLLRHNMVHFVSSDAHTSRGRSPRLLKSKEIIEQEIGQGAAELLFNNNVRVLKDEEISVPEPERVKNTGSFAFFVNLRRLVSGLTRQGG